MEDKKCGILEEAPGVKSSKRLFGVILLSGGGALMLAVGIVAIFRVVGDASAALTAGQTLCATGGALLGIGVFEGIGRRLSGGGGV